MSTGEIDYTEWQSPSGWPVCGFDIEPDPSNFGGILLTVFFASGESLTFSVSEQLAECLQGALRQELRMEGSGR